MAATNVFVFVKTLSGRWRDLEPHLQMLRRRSLRKTISPTITTDIEHMKLATIANNILSAAEFLDCTIDSIPAIPTHHLMPPRTAELQQKIDQIADKLVVQINFMDVLREKIAGMGNEQEELWIQNKEVFFTAERTWTHCIESIAVIATGMWKDNIDELRKGADILSVLIK